jgi:hypothetical protein
MLVSPNQSYFLYLNGWHTIQLSFLWSCKHNIESKHQTNNTLLKTSSEVVCFFLFYAACINSVISMKKQTTTSYDISLVPPIHIFGSHQTSGSWNLYPGHYQGGFMYHVFWSDKAFIKKTLKIVVVSFYQSFHRRNLRPHFVPYELIHSKD